MGWGYIDGVVWEMGRESKWVSEEKKTGEREWRKVRVVVWITVYT